MKTLRIIILFTLLYLSGAYSSVSAQEKRSEWYVGISGSYRWNHMSYSSIDKEYFPTNKYTGSGVFSLFVQGEFGRRRNFAIRPEIAFLQRGGKLKEIGSIDYDDFTTDVNYTLKKKSFDLRVPLIYNFCQATAIVRPYVFVAPVLGFTTGGTIRWQEEYADSSIEGYELEASKANMSSVYFAGQVGVGVKFAIPVANDQCYFGIEANYEYGFTDTYGSKEKDGVANDVVHLFSRSYELSGNRKLSGFELTAVLSIPFSIFKSKKKPAPVFVPPVPLMEESIEEEEVVEEVKPCYSLEEIIDLIEQGQDVEGKTLCAIDAITFDFAKSTIKADSYDYLDNLAEIIIRTNMSVEVKGHTDNVGTEEFNMNLSRDRAEAVMDYLASKGVRADKLKCSYYGMTRPLTTNDTDEGRAMNRRVEFTFLNNF